MIVFLFYLVAILSVLTIAAAIADAIGHFFPHWLSEQAAARERREDSSHDWERGD